MVAAPCARWQFVRGPVRKCGRGRPFNGIVRQPVNRAFVLVVASLATVVARASGPDFEAFQAAARNLAGPNARDCGLVRLREPIGAAVSCIKHAWSKRQSFFVTFQRQGFDSTIFNSIVRNDGGEMWSIVWDNDVTGGSRSKSSLSQTRCTTIVETDPAPTCTQARLSFDEARSLALAELKRRKMPRDQLAMVPKLSLYRDGGGLWWAFHFSPGSTAPRLERYVLVNDETKAVRFSEGM